MTIPADMATCPDRMSELALQLRAHVQAIRAAHPSQAVLDETAGIVIVIAALGAESARMRALLAAARSTGQMEHQTVAVETLELHPVNVARRGVDELRSGGDREHELMLESLHRAGDHTLDVEEPVNAPGYKGGLD